MKRVALAAAAFALSGAASADIVFCDDLAPCGGGSGDVENVLLNIGETGPLVTGETNITSTVINFSTEGPVELINVAGGQARIEGVGGGQVTDLLIDAADPNLGFLKIQFNVDATADTAIQLVGTDQFGTDFVHDAVANGNGQNFFTAYTINDQWIDTMLILGDGINAITDLQQVRVNPGAFPPDGGGGGNEVPLPAAAWLFISALGGLGVVGRKRKLEQEAA